LHRGEAAAVACAHDHIVGVEPVAEHQERQHAREQGRGLPHGSRRTRHSGGLHEALGAFALAAAEDACHEQAHENGEHHRPNRARDAQVNAKHARRKEDGEDINRGAGIQERRGRAKPRADAVDAREHGEDAARTYGQHRARYGSHAVRRDLVRVRAHVAQHCLLRQKRDDAARDEERGNHAGERVVAGVPLQQLERLQDGFAYFRVGQWQGVSDDEHACHGGENLQFFSVFHAMYSQLQAGGTPYPQAVNRYLAKYAIVE